MNSSRNVAASVKQRVLNLAKTRHRPFQELLQYYGMERFLYRLSQSVHREKYILKGALTLRAWNGSLARPTMDIDMLAITSNLEENIQQHINDIMHTEVISDGIVFHSESMCPQRITEGVSYHGLRVRFVGHIERTKIPMQLDIGFGDSIYPMVESNTLPTLLDYPHPNVLCYSKESVIAEKFQVMIQLGLFNSRMKDFYDIWTLSRSFSFQGSTLQEAIRRTFVQRNTDIKPPIMAFSEVFIKDNQTMWSAFRKRMQQFDIPEDFQTINRGVQAFLMPIHNEVTATMCWSPDTGWTAH